MKLLLIVLSMTSSAFASSNAYNLKVDVTIDGKHISSPRVTVKEGEPATITHKVSSVEQFIEIVATEGSIQNRRGILMKFTIGTIGKNGERTVLTRPEVLTQENEPTQLTQESKKNNNVEHLSLSVIAQRKTL